MCAALFSLTEPHFNILGSHQFLFGCALPEMLDDAVVKRMVDFCNIQLLEFISGLLTKPGSQSRVRSLSNMSQAISVSSNKARKSLFSFKLELYSRITTKMTSQTPSSITWFKELLDSFKNS
jgi:hypothetical protein